MTRGAVFTGGSSNNYDREEHDFYATPPSATRKFLETYDISKYNKILEPSCGMGHMSEVIKDFILPTAILHSKDLIYRGYGEVEDFLKSDNEDRYDLIITNPPFKLALEFIEKSLIKSDNVIILAKIQLLEGQERSLKLKNMGLKYIYGCTSRVSCWQHGLELNPNTGKSWGGAMMLAWYVFDKNYTGEPIYRWL